MIDWVDAACKDWGACTRWILFTKDQGYPTMDSIAKARAGALTLGDYFLNQHFDEVRAGRALEVARAALQEPMMPESLLATLWAQYAVKMPSKLRISAVAKYLGKPLSIPEYWRNVDRMHWFLAGRLHVEQVVETKKFLQVSTKERSCTVP